MVIVVERKRESKMADRDGVEEDGGIEKNTIYYFLLTCSSPKIKLVHLFLYNPVTEIPKITNRLHKNMFDCSEAIVSLDFE